ncbi:hypothetical protein WAA86_02885 [Sediminicola sp. 1XM1-17]
MTIQKTLPRMEAVLVKIPRAVHCIANSPSSLTTKIAHTLVWYVQYKIKELE